MGVDAGIFAKKSKKYFWFDRLSNIQKYYDLSDDLVTRLYQIDKSLMDQNNTLSINQIMEFLESNLNAWNSGEESVRYHSKNVLAIIQFVRQYPNDCFFVSADDEDAYDLIGEMNGESGGLWKGEYTEWKPD